MSGLATAKKCGGIARARCLHFRNLYGGTKLVASGHDRYGAYVYVAIESSSAAPYAMEAALRALPLQRRRGAKVSA